MCIDKNTQKEQLETLEKVKNYISSKLEESYTKFKKSQNSKKGSKAKWENFIKIIDKITKRNKRLFEINYEHKNQEIDFKLNQDWYKREQKAAGKFVIVTNGDKSPLLVLKTYKELNNVESSFNCIKNQLDLRPINHYKNERVKAHVFICILALLIEKIMAKSLKDISPQSALEELNRLKLGTFQLERITKKQLSEISFNQKNILIVYFAQFLFNFTILNQKIIYYFYFLYF